MTLEIPEAFNFTSIQYTQNTHPEAQISLRFTLHPAIFDIKDFQILEMYPMSPE